MFWLLCLLMLVAALAMLLRNRDPVQHQPLARDLILATYRQQFTDLDNDLANGVLDQEQAARARLELEHALLAALENNQAGDPDPARAAPAKPAGDLFNILVIVFLPVLAFTLYYKLGEPGLANFSPAALSADSDGENTEQLPSIEELVVGLEQRLEQSPGDQKGLWMLTRTYMALGRYAEARQRVEQLYALSGDEVPVLLLYANVLMLLGDESLAPTPEELVGRALEMEPGNISALWLAGMLAQEKGDTDTALLHWRKLQPLVAADAEASEQLGQLLEEAERVAGSSASETQEDAVATPGITVEVSIAEHLRDRVEEGASLYVIARADDGLPMPVAVARLPAADLPLVVVLDDTKAMMPTRLLSAFKQVELVARISHSGNAIAQPGDLASIARPAQPGADANLQLHIEKILP